MTKWEELFYSLAGLCNTRELRLEISLGFSHWVFSSLDIFRVSNSIHRQTNETVDEHGETACGLSLCVTEDDRFSCRIPRKTKLALFSSARRAMVRIEPSLFSAPYVILVS